MGKRKRFFEKVPINEFLNHFYDTGLFWFYIEIDTKCDEKKEWKMRKKNGKSEKGSHRNNFLS